MIDAGRPDNAQMGLRTTLHYKMGSTSVLVPIGELDPASEALVLRGFIDTPHT